MIEVICKDELYTYDVYHITKAFFPAENVRQWVDKDAGALLRVFSQDGSGIRTVKVNTQITLTQHLSGTGGQDQNNVMYLINNKNGGLSLITPNYAGNVEPDQMDVMLEAVQ